jgi:hypothetical protein
MSGDEIPPDVTEWAHELRVSQLTCRDYGHAWRPLTARYAEEGSIVRTQRCTRCRTEREQTLSLSGMVLGGHYAYPEGYLAPRGIGRLTADHRAVLRVESIRRLIEGAS